MADALSNSRVSEQQPEQKRTVPVVILTIGLIRMHLEGKMCKFMSPDISPLIRFDVPSFLHYIASIFHSCFLITSACLYLLLG